MRQMGGLVTFSVGDIYVSPLPFTALAALLLLEYLDNSALQLCGPALALNSSRSATPSVRACSVRSHRVAPGLGGAHLWSGSMPVGAPLVVASRSDGRQCISTITDPR